MAVKPSITSSPAPNGTDVFADLVGHIGKWQLIIFGTVFLVKLSSGWVQMAILFLTPSLKFWCAEWAPGQEVVAVNGSCYKECVRYEYDTSPFVNTVVSEWGLVCGRAWLASLTQTVLQLGILVGSIIFGFFSDRYGRKNTFLVSIVILIASGFAVPFSPNYSTFTALRFVLGVSSGGTMVISFVIVMEAIGPRYREFFGCFFHVPFMIGHMSLPLFAYYYRSWDSYSLALAVPALIYLFYFFTLKESPRWLLTVGRVEEATEVVVAAAKLNNLPTNGIPETLKKLSADMKTRADEPKLNYTALFLPELRLRTLGSCCMWLIAGLTFFGFNQYIGQTSTNPFVTVSVAGAIQVPANLATMWLIRRLGRRLTTITFFFFSGVCILALGFVPDVFAIKLTLGTLGVSFASVVTASVYIYSSELYPTVVRNMGMGAVSMCMRLGSMIAPFVSNLSATKPWLPNVIFGLAPILACLAVMPLPETKGTKLPDSLDDIKKETIDRHK